MLTSLAALLFLAATPAASAAPADSAASDSAASRRVVREFPPIVVPAGRVQDPGSIETVRTIEGRALRALPVDRLVDAIGLQAGVVARGEDLHVRGGRAGDVSISVSGVPLNDPQTGRPMELPLFAVRSVDLLAGGLDADHAGALAGELDIETMDPTPRPAAIARWVSDGRRSGSYDAGLVRVSGPIGILGLGVAAAAEARLDDLGLPSLRTRGRSDVLGAAVGWRQDNRMLAWLKLAPIEHPGRGALEVFASRTVRAPYDPMFAFDGFVTPNGDRSGFPYTISEDPIDDTSVHYHAADHDLMTDERRLAVVASRRFASARTPIRVAAGALRSTSLTSVGLTHDSGYIDDLNRLAWGAFGSASSDPYFAYLGDTQYFSDRDGRRLFARADVSAAPGIRQRLTFGAGASYDEVRLREIDAVVPLSTGFPALRSYHAWAPGGFAYGQHRFEYAGLIWNAGLRLQAFTAGPQADSSRTVWTWSPRLGFAYPVSDRDAFSVSYARIHQDPDRDLLYDNRTFAPNTHPLGNGRIEPAEMVSYQAAVRHLFDERTSLQLGVFYRDVFGQPGVRNAPPAPGAFRLRYSDADDGHAAGVELAVRRERRGVTLELAYTFMNAWGTESEPGGLAFGPAFGERPLPLGTRPLDWDVHHALALAAQLGGGPAWSLSWSTRVASGLPWTPLPDTLGAAPRAYTDESLVNSRRLPWSENTDVAARWAAPFLPHGRVLLVVTNLFDERGERQVTIGGAPNPVINTERDDDTAYRTQTGLGGGAYYDGGWIPVHDRRLLVRARSIRLGIEFGS